MWAGGVSHVSERGESSDSRRTDRRSNKPPLLSVICWLADLFSCYLVKKKSTKKQNKNTLASPLRWTPCSEKLNATMMFVWLFLLHRTKQHRSQCDDRLKTSAEKTRTNEEPESIGGNGSLAVGFFFVCVCFTMLFYSTFSRSQINVFTTDTNTVRSASKFP